MIEYLYNHDSPKMSYPVFLRQQLILPRENAVKYKCGGTWQSSQRNVFSLMSKVRVSRKHSYIWRSRNFISASWHSRVLARSDRKYWSFASSSIQAALLYVAQSQTCAVVMSMRTVLVTSRGWWGCAFVLLFAFFNMKNIPALHMVYGPFSMLFRIFNAKNASSWRLFLPLLLTAELLRFTFLFL